MNIRSHFNARHRDSLMCLMSSLVPFLIHCADRRCDTPSPVCSSSALVRSFAENQLLLRDDTTRDGNCGVHALFLSLADFADRNLAIKQLRAWKALSKVKTNTAQLIKHLREVAVQWMRENADLEVWEGMRFRDLALRMSHLQEPYDNHLKRMLCDKEWVDASVIMPWHVSFVLMSRYGKHIRSLMC